MATSFCAKVRKLSSSWLRSKYWSKSKSLTRRISASCCLSKDELQKVPPKGLSEEDVKKLEELKNLWKQDRSNEIIINKQYTQLEGVDLSEIEFEIDPDKRPILRMLKNDYLRSKEHLLTHLGFEIEKKVPDYYSYSGPAVTDVLIIGGGAIGSSAAYFIKEKVFDGLNVMVVERDFTYSMSSSSLSVGGLRQQFSLPESIEMSLYGADFIRSAPRLLQVDGLPTPNLCFEPYGYLLLATEEGAETLAENSKLQNELGAKNILLNPWRIRERFPWINTDGIALGCLGLEKEGWFDPWGLLLAFKTKAMSLGADYVKGEVVGFQFFHPYSSEFIDDNYFKRLGAAIVRYPDGKYATIKFAVCVVAAGADSGIIGKLAGFGTGNGIMSIPLPVERRKRYVYCLHCPDGPGLNTPLMVDPSGVYFRREGLCNKYICGMSPKEDDEPSVNNLDVDYNYFDDKIWPTLAKRVPTFEKMKVVNGWAGFYEYNPIDKNGIIGTHPVHSNVIFACGFSGHGIQHAPAIGRAVSELVINDDYNTIDLSRLGFLRFANENFLVEKNIV